MTKVGIAMVAVLFVGSGCASTAPNGSIQKPAGPFHATDPTVASAVSSAIDGADSSPDLAQSPVVACIRESAQDSMSGRAGINCNIRYVIKEPAGINSDIEMIQPTAGIWKTLFSDRAFQGGYIEVSGPTTTVGGKSETGTLFSIACDRAAARQIDWDNIDGHGLRTLCTYIPLAKGLPGSS